MNAPASHSRSERALRAQLETLVRETLGVHLRSLETIPAGLGTRRFFRLRLDGTNPTTAIARVDTPEDPNLRPAGVAPEPKLEPLRRFLEEKGIPVPRSFASDEAHGVELLEDLGSTSLEQACDRISSAERFQLYAEACAIALRLQQLAASPDEIPAFGRHLDATLLRYKAEQVIEWALPWSLGRASRVSEASVVREAFDLIAEECREAPQRLAHRDYKAANLYVCADAPSDRRLVLIDLQGALLAPPEYDFVCLLRDPHVALPNTEIARHLESVQSGLSESARQDFARRFCLLTLTRVGKDLSRYLFAAHERSDLRYLPLLPEATRSLRSAAALAAGWDPRLERLAELFQAFPKDWSSADPQQRSEESCGH